MSGLVIAALILLLVVPRQFRPRPIRIRQLILLPAVALALGVFMLAWDQVSLTGMEVLYLGLQLVVAVLAGSTRGFVIQIVPRGPFALRVGGWALAASWAGTIIARFSIDALFHVLISADAAIVASLPLFVGLTLATQNAVLALRVKHAGLRFLTADEQRRFRERRHRRESPAP